MTEFRNILVRATNWVGDAVMGVPAFQALRDRFPAARISILARPWVAGLYGREPFCDELISYEAPKGWHGLGEKVSVATQLRARNFDCAVLFQNAFEAAALVRMAGIPVRIGYAVDGRDWLLTDAVRIPRPDETPLHQRFYYLELLRRAKLIESYATDGSVRLSAASAAAEAGRQRFQNAGIREAVIGVSPGAAYGGAKRWLPERFAQAAARVASERNATVALFGASEERSACKIVQQELEKLGQRSVDFAGATSLAEFIEMAAACEAFLTNDSGPMHIASALGVPTVAIFGATDHIATGPTGPLAEVVRQPVDCSPCLLRECPIDHRCMTRVTSDQVSDAALRLIGIGSTSAYQER